MDKEEERKKIEEFLFNDVKRLLKGTAGKHTDLSKVIVWLEDLNLESETVTLGLALGSGTGCSPFCGCAAKDIVQYMGKKLGNEFAWVKFVRGQPSIPDQSILDKWNSD